ncbi:DUF3786 domain-containing protein [Desulfitibacter alkalitolerans]|uniref:DUF3786 domain-containing protein n=1 Tax=Desulfitibacter alkalitolerans TaxID=264641 RepID=UPI00146FBDBC|nr:DUF3786 domain-containing protein [Desulfitibacter alkalitolerans]
MDIRNYMLQKTNIPSYDDAFNAAINSFSKKTPDSMCEKAGAVYNEKTSTIALTSLAKCLEVKYPAGEVVFKNTLEIPLLEWRLIAINYLARATGTKPANEPVSFRQLEGGSLYYPAFEKRAIRPLVSLFDSSSMYDLKRVFEFYKGFFIERSFGDFTVVFDFFPMLPIEIKYYKGDGEVPSNVSMHFDSTANQYLHTEDAAVAGELLILLLIQENKFLKSL